MNICQIEFSKTILLEHVSHATNGLGEISLANS